MSITGSTTPISDASDFAFQEFANQKLSNCIGRITNTIRQGFDSIRMYLADEHRKLESHHRGVRTQHFGQDHITLLSRIERTRPLQISGYRAEHIHSVISMYNNESENEWEFAKNTGMVLPLFTSDKGLVY
eukprot:scaffold2381_cov128-Cylindrotheca_fusiformis.AAC.10